MAASPDELRDPAPACPDCGMAVAPGQRRCTNCGASVEVRRRLPRRTPLLAALIVTAFAGGGVVLAQAAVTEEASIDASAPADAASAPISVAGAPLPAAERQTSTAPKVEEPEPVPTPEVPTLDIPQVDQDLLDQAQEARDEAQEAEDANSRDGTPTDDDKPADPDDLGEPRTVKVVKAINYEPVKRLGVEFGKPKAAIDKRSRTVWDVTVPADGQPYNVGIVLDLGDESRRVSALTMNTPTPGFGFELYRTDRESVPDTLEEWKKVSDTVSASDDLILNLTDGDPKWARYVLVYLTTTASAEDTRAAISNLEVLP